MKSSLVISALLFAGFISCRNPEQNYKPEQSTISDAAMKETLINQSRQRMRDEVARIDSWIERNNLEMTSTGTGVRYRIIKDGNGPVPQLLARVELEYELSLLDGTLCYSSDSTGKLDFILGQSAEPSGLQEIILKIKEGSTAQVIVPSYLGYGLTGDGDCISSDESLVYRIKLLHVTPN